MSENLEKYLSYLRARGTWYSDDYPKTLFYHVLKLYVNSRPAIFLVVTALLANSLRFKEGFGLFDATVTLMLITVQMGTVCTWWVLSKNYHNALMRNYNKLVSTYDEPWMTDFRQVHSKKLWKIVNFLSNFMTGMAMGYIIGPFAVDLILHTGFDVLEKPFFFPHAFTAITDLSTWNWEYYIMTVLGWWFVLEATGITQTQFIEYVLFLAFHIIELRMFKEFLRTKGLNESGSEGDKLQFLRQAITWHSDLTKLNSDMKAFFGFTCAFLCVFTSLSVTMNAFAALLSPNFTTSLLSFYGVVLYASIGFSYTAVGQLLENEGDDVYVFLNELPWHEYLPSLRRDFTMMIIHAQKPIGINFHGGWPMNLENYMEIITNAYSLFTMLRTTVAE